MREGSHCLGSIKQGASVYAAYATVATKNYRTPILYTYKRANIRNMKTTGQVER